jgi:pimeloyl-ACP methyl ester carboxylesterase
MFVDGQLSPDWLSNIDLAAINVDDNNAAEDEQGESFDQSNATQTAAPCLVHRGYYNAYHNFEFKKQVETLLRQCQTDCPQCETVLTGHSQGGALATIMALDLLMESSNDDDASRPLHVVTFGATQALGSGCVDRIIQHRRYIPWKHFIMAVDGAFGLTYDAVPMLFPQFLGAVAEYAQPDFGYIGHELLLSMDDRTAMVDRGANVHQLSMPYNAAAHSEDLYAQWLWERMESSKNATVSTSGFQDGSLCNKNDECASNKCQREGQLHVQSKCQAK